MRHLILSCVLFISSFTFASSDYTDHLIHYYENSEETKSISERVSSYHFIIVPGLFDSVKRYITKHDYEDYVRWFETHNISHEILHLQTQCDPETNHETIKTAIENSPNQKKVFLLAHSYGGILSFSTLLAYPHLRDKVIGLITMQTPYYGSRLADRLKEGTFTNWLSHATFRILGGDCNGFMQFGREHRSQWLQEHEAGIREILSKISVFQLVTQYDDSYLFYFGWLTEKSDGLVEIDSQRLSFGNYGTMQGWHHTDTIVRDNARAHLNRQRLLEAILQILIKH